MTALAGKGLGMHGHENLICLGPQGVNLRFGDVIKGWGLVITSDGCPTWSCALKLHSFFPRRRALFFRPIHVEGRCSSSRDELADDHRRVLSGDYFHISYLAGWRNLAALQ